MNETIRNLDGSVYMTFPPAVPSASDLEGWYVRTITSADLPGQGTYAITSTECDSRRSLLAHVGAFEESYGYRPREVKIGESTYRWTWEHLGSDGVRISDAVWATKIG